jgi:uncharacterized membrane protein (DUF485 family)
LTTFFLIVLAAAWVAVFFPSLRRAKAASPYPATKAFKRSMSSVSPMASGRLVMTHVTARQDARQLAKVRKQRQRYNTFTSLLILAGSTAFVAIIGRGVWIELHLAVDGILLGYVAWLIENRNRRAERSQKVRRIRPARQPVSIEAYEADTGT